MQPVRLVVFRLTIEFRLIARSDLTGSYSSEGFTRDGGTADGRSRERARFTRSYCIRTYVFNNRIGLPKWG